MPQVISPARPRRTTELLLLIIALGIGLGAHLLSAIGMDQAVTSEYWVQTGVMTIMALVFHLVLRLKARYADPYILPIAVTLNGLGIAMIHRLDLESGDTAATRQLMWTVVAMGAAIVVLWFLRDHRLLRRRTYLFLAAAGLLLLLPLVPGLGMEINGARIWINVGVGSFQPGEVAKIMLAVFFAGYLSANRDLILLAAPGSTFKLIDTVAMLESGQYQPDQILDLPNQIILPNSNTPLRNFEGGLCGRHGQQTLEWIFAQSCNTPFAEAAMELGQDRIRTTAENFGFNQSLEVPLSVSPSRFPEDLDDAALAQSSLGQRDVAATALQMNMVASAIANDGTLMRPQLIDTIRGADLTTLEQPQPEVYKNSTTPEVADQVTEMMKEVVRSGTAWQSRSDQVEIAAKTGTAQLGAGDSNVNSWITGFAPADDPQVAVTLVYQNTDYEAGHTLTATNMKRIMEAVVVQ